MPVSAMAANIYKKGGLKKEIKKLFAEKTDIPMIGNANLCFLWARDLVSILNFDNLFYMPRSQQAETNSNKLLI
jgi:hypothetical protein